MTPEHLVRVPGTQSSIECGVCQSNDWLELKWCNFRNRFYCDKCLLNRRGWLGIDFDRSLAEYYGKTEGLSLGPPVPTMLAFVKALIAAGWEVRIFTARVADETVREEQTAAIKAWCLEHVGQELEVTCIKDHHCCLIFDDNAINVQRNTGVIRNDLPVWLGV